MFLSQRFFELHRSASLFRLVMLCGVLACLTSSARAQESQPIAKELVEGSCLSVSDGDTVRFQWNPQFDQPGAVTGLRSFELGFISEEEKRTSRVPMPGLLLVANPRQHGQLPNNPEAEIKKSANGYYSMTFHLNTGSREGQFILFSAEAAPVFSEEHSGPAPRMTNNPASSFYCLNVVAQPGRRR